MNDGPELGGREKITEQQQNVVFAEAASESVETSPSITDSTLYATSSRSMHLDQFLSRPVRILSTVWNSSTSSSVFLQRFSPWRGWLANPSVKEKMKNFAYFRSKLKLRFVMNSSPFHYGKMMLVYLPYGNDTPPSTGDFTTAYNSQVNLVEAGLQTLVDESPQPQGANRMWMRYASTCMHDYLHAGDNNVVEMTLPFVWHENYLNVRTTNYESPGVLVMIPMNPLRFAKEDSPPPVEITVYAWAEDVQLDIPTPIQLASFTATSKKRKKKDEWGSGIISTPATAVAKAAGDLAAVPWLAPYAKATEIAAGAVAGIAKIFGFSRPRNLQDASYNHLKLVSNMAVGSGQDNAVPLTLDPKQEVTIDPRVVGAPNEDELAVKSIVTKEQYLTTFEWGKSEGLSGNPVLFKIAVSPSVPTTVSWTPVPLQATRKVHMDTPAGYVGRTMGYWRGSLIYRFEVIASRMHSGRLLVQYVPLVVGNSWNTPYEENVTISMVMDLSETNCIEIRIPYTSAYPYLPMFPRQTVSAQNRTLHFEKTMWPPNQGDSSGDLFNGSLTNLFPFMGQLQVFSLNDLTAPIPTDLPYSDSTAPIDINVYMRCGDDFEFAVPGGTSRGTGTSTVPLPSAVDSWTQYPLIPASYESCQTMTIYDTNNMDDKADMVFFGESIPTFRSLMKRYCLNYVFKYATSGTDVSTVGAKYPLYGFSPHFTREPLNAQGYNANLFYRRVRHTYFSYLRPMFLAARGGFRSKYVPLDFNDGGVSKQRYLLWTERYATVDTAIANLEYEQNSHTLGADVIEQLPVLSAGGDIVDCSYCPIAETDMPYYEPARFHLACNPVNDSATDITGTFTAGTARQFNVLKNPVAHLNSGLDIRWIDREAYSAPLMVYSAAAEDTTLHFFQGVPAVWLMEDA